MISKFTLLRSLKSRIFFYFVILMLLVQVIVFWSIRLAIKEQVEQRLQAELTSATTIFETIFATSQLTLNNFNQVSNKILAENFTDDRRSFLVVLENFRKRVDADLAMTINNDGIINAQIIRDELPDGTTDLMLGEQQGEEFSKSTGWLSKSENTKFYQKNNQVFQFSVSEVKVGPERIGWIGLGNRINDSLASEFYNLNGFHIKFFLSNSSNCTLFASSDKSLYNRTEEKTLTCDTAVNAAASGFESSKPIVLGKLNDKEVVAILYGSREDLLSSLQQRWMLLSLLTGLTIFLSFIGAYLIAAAISHPVRQLVTQAKHIARGHYEKSVTIDDEGELGALANEFSLMQKAVIEREREILHNALHDPLTNLPNRNRLLQILDSWLSQKDLEHAIFQIKINHVREINESFGHEIGDQVIKVVGKRLESIQKVEQLSHIREDEFVLLVNDISKSSVLRWIEKITQIMKQPYCTDAMTLHLKTNIGVALSNQADSDPCNFLRMADSALQLARNEKQLFKLYDRAQDISQVERLSLMNDLHDAITDNQMQLFYQPKLDLASGKIMHVEALIRWRHPEKGIVAPDLFIPIAENTGQIDLLTLWVLEEAARQHSEWKKENKDISIAINVSAQNLNNDDFYGSVSFIVQQYGLDVNAIHLEVTESAVAENPDRAIAILKKFYDSGFKLSIDDYGTGYSSLAQLKRLPMHELKIDMSFIKKLPQDDDDKTIVKSTIELAHNMGLTVVAEGVETESAMNWLQQQGCETIQGYHISRPLPADEFMQWLKQSDYI